MAARSATVLREADALIRLAITQKRLVRFSLHGYVRIAEPHDYGIRNGVPQLIAYQISGGSKSGKLPDWRWVILSEASDLQLLDETFPGGRRAPSGKHSRWEHLFLRVDGATDDGF